MKKDIIIIGAGPAGLSCAIELAKAGRDFIVLDQWQRGQKDHDGHPKLCGGGLITRSRNFLGPLQSETVPNFTVIFKHGKHTVQLKSEASSVDCINRDDLADELASRAEGLGAVINFGVRVQDIDLKSKIITTNAGKIQYNTVIGADGFFSVVKKELIKQGTITRDTDFEQAVEYSVPKESVHRPLTLDAHKLFSGGYAWIFPHKDSYFIGAGEANCTRSKKKNSLYHDLLLWAKQEGLPHAPQKIHGWFIPYEFKGYAFENNVYLIGDAAGFAGGLTGEGISPALLSGYDVAHVVIDRAYIPDRINTLLKSKRREEVILKIGNKFPWLRSPFYTIIIWLAKNKALRTIPLWFLNHDKLNQKTPAL